MLRFDDRLPLPSDGQRIAVIGAGIAGLSAAWLLSERYRVTLFEAAGTLGGHTHTVDVELDGAVAPVDTGFLVFNERTYPNLIALFSHLGVASVESEMSFSVRLENPALEWAGSSLATVFGQKRNLLRPDFWRMLSDILRFNRESTAWLDASADETTTLAEFLERGAYSRAFSDWYLLPMAAAIWSCPTASMRQYPLATFVRFCRNHGLLQVFDRPVWRTVRGGGREYVRKLAEGLDDIRLASPVRAVIPRRTAVDVVVADGTQTFDQVVFACHSDQTLALLGERADAEQHRLLAALRYQPNRAVLHTDAALLPRDARLWSAWNYLSGHGEAGNQAVGVSYLINRLQPLPFRSPVIVTLNPPVEPRAANVIAEFEYAHPLFDGPAIAAQRELETLQGRARLWFCGAWAGYGFHEDGLKSALAVANRLGVRAPWQSEGAGRDAA